MPRGIPNNKIAGPITKPEEIPAQPSKRAAETRRERRRRDDGNLDRMAGYKLAIPTDIQEQADREGKTLRWVLDTPGRMQQMMADDWDKVPDVASVAADKESGDQLVLCAKYKDWFDADQASAAKLLDQRDASIRRGKHTDQTVPQSEYNDEVVKSNRISRQAGA